MARFERGERVRYTGPTTRYVRKGDVGTVTRVTPDFVFADWDDSPSELSMDWCVAPSDVHVDGDTWLQRVGRIVRGVLP